MLCNTIMNVEHVTNKRKHICESNCDTTPVKMSSADDGNDIRDYKTRCSLPVNAKLLNFNKCPRGHCNKRDAAVLGKYPGCTIPEQVRTGEHVLVSFFLHHDLDSNAMKTYLGKNSKGEDNFKPPDFLEKAHDNIDVRTRVHHPILSNEQWISSDLTQIHWKKKPWKLSGNMKSIAGVKYPQWVIVMTPKVNGILQYDKSVRSEPFEVRSKDQPKQTAFAEGRQVARRRTPETYRAEQILKAEQADILKLTDDINSKTKQHEEYVMRLQFALAIVNSDPQCAFLASDIHKCIDFHQKNLQKM